MPALLISAPESGVCARFVKEGLDSALNRPRPGQKRKFGRQEAHLVAIACSDPRRTHGLDAATACRQGGGDGVCREHLPRDCAPDAQKNELKPWKKKKWCIPEVSGEFVARMEDVLDLEECAPVSLQRGARPGRSRFTFRDAASWTAHQMRWRPSHRDDTAGARTISTLTSWVRCTTLSSQPTRRIAKRRPNGCVQRVSTVGSATRWY